MTARFAKGRLFAGGGGMLAAVAGGLWLLLPQSYLQLSSGGSERLYHLPHRRFEVSFVHSIQRTEVDEYFRVNDDGNLVLWQTRYSSLGVGLPDGGALGFRLENGRFVLATARVFDHFDWWVTPVARQVLHVGQRSWPFENFALPGEKLSFHGRELRGYQRLLSSPFKKAVYGRGGK